MARSYKFAIIRLAPDEIRGESLNIGVVILSDLGVDIRSTRRLDRVRAISGALDIETLGGLFRNIQGLDELARKDGVSDPLERLKMFSRMGPLSLSQAGTFVADTTVAYEAQISAILRALVEPEPGLVRTRKKKTKLLAQIKGVFRREHILARHDEGLDSHRIVSGLELADGLVADMVLRNGAYHVIETVDASGDEHSFRKAVSEIAVAALVLERARMQFAESATNSRLVFMASPVLERVARPSLDAAEHQGAELINWASSDDRDRFVHSIASLATPIEPKKKVRFVAHGTGGLFH